MAVLVQLFLLLLAIKKRKKERKVFLELVCIYFMNALWNASIPYNAITAKGINHSW